MSKIALSGNASGTGTFTIASPNSNTDRTLNLPDNSGTVLTTGSTFAGTGPAFSAYSATNQTVSNNTTTKLQVSTEEFDTNSNYDNSTNYRFTPTVAGYYLFIFGGYGTDSSGLLTLNFLSLFKNGSLLPAGTARSGSYTYTPSNTYVDGTAQGSVLVYMNGSTDYMELYGRLVGTGTLNYGQSNFQAFLARSAT